MIQLDLNNPEFLANLFALNKPDAWAVFKTLKLLQAMTWEQIQASKGLHWELIQSRQGPGGQRLYSMRISRSCRAVAWRDGPWLRLLSLHPNHDSAYRSQIGTNEYPHGVPMAVKENSWKELYLGASSTLEGLLSTVWELPVEGPLAISDRPA